MGKRGTSEIDVAVVGAGPAGLAAAVRVRFVKRYAAVPLTCTVFDPGTPGGLLNAGSDRTITGPGFTMRAADVLSGLLADVKRHEIPVVQEAVSSIARTDRGFVLTTDDGVARHALSVVVAGGSRLLSNELSCFPDGVFITYKGFGFLKGLVEQAARHAGDLPVAVVTNRRLTGYAGLLEALGNRVLYLVPRGEKAGMERLPGEVVECARWNIEEKSARGFRIRVVNDDGDVSQRSAGALFLDYVAFQLEPLLPDLPAGWKQEPAGVPWVSSYLESSIPGLFFAGDVTCRYASVATALADGVVAGFGAYRHAYKVHFGHEPPLFAYRAGEDPARFLDGEWPDGYSGQE